MPQPQFEILELHSWSIQGIRTHPYHIYDNKLACWVCDTTEGNGDDFIGYESENAAKSRIELLNSIANSAWLGRRSGAAFFLTIRSL
ncbi:hypothetical protein [Allocoleopsis sp.]|uniref:hypothetical protein n=1 Tax=Allocoleopsis sp. TaxID=3088169 RepID=UPI002FD443F1